MILTYFFLFFDLLITIYLLRIYYQTCLPFLSNEYLFFYCFLFATEEIFIYLYKIWFEAAVIIFNFFEKILKYLYIF